MLVTSSQDLGIVIREERLARRLSQTQLATMSGVSRASLARIEAGHKRPEFNIVLDLIAALGLVLQIEDAPTPKLDLDAHIERTTGSA